MRPIEDTAPPEQAIALNYAQAEWRPALRLFAAFDERLARVVLSAVEPLPAQLRLAWWREQFLKSAGQRPKGEPMLAAMEDDWPGFEAPCRQLVDGWEQLLQELPLPDGSLEQFAKGRTATFSALLSDKTFGDATEQNGQVWALADLAAKLPESDLKADVMVQATSMTKAMPRLPKDLRFLTVLAGLGKRAIARGGGPLLSGRADVAAALRLGLLGR